MNHATSNDYDVEQRYNEMYLMETVSNILDQWKFDQIELASESDSSFCSTWSNGSSQEDRIVVLNAIEDVIYRHMCRTEGLNMVHDFEEEKAPCFTYPAYRDWRNVEYIPSQGLVPINSEIKTTTISVGNAKYGRIMLTLQCIHSLLCENIFATKRELFYQHVNNYGCQAHLDEAVTIISVLLQIPRLKLHVLATTKGLVAGNLSFINEDGFEVDCRMATGGENVPTNVESMYSIRTDARMILVVEKDAVFQTLLQGNVMQQLKVILITAKGVPDLNTRQLVHKLWKTTCLPVLALVDADPYGIEIMCVYRFGSLTTTWCAESLAVPSMRWIGLHPSDFPNLDSAQMKSFSKHDEIKCNAILNRPYIEHWPHLKEQLETISSWAKKAEIENLVSTPQYIMHKIAEHEWV